MKGMKNVKKSQKNLVPLYKTALDIYSQIIINNFNTFVYFLPDLSQSSIRPDPNEPEIMLRVDKKIIEFVELRGNIDVRLKGSSLYDFIRINIDMSKAKIIPPKKELEILPNSRSPIFPFVDIVPLADEVRINHIFLDTIAPWRRGNFQDYRWFQRELEVYRTSFYDIIFRIRDRDRGRYYITKSKVY